jgi:5-formyltetrahydrofolate cyclo-ligase
MLISYDLEMSSSEQEPSRTPKDQLRRKVSAARDALPRMTVDAFSMLIHVRLLGVPEVQSASSIFIYVSHGKEVFTCPYLIEALLEEKKTVTVPLITGEGIMEAHRITGIGDLTPGRFGILAPREKNPWPGPLDVVIAPGVAFTARGDRLGRGKGYYDRFLAAHPGGFTIGLGYEIQLVDEIPVLPGDQRLDMVITEKRIIRAPDPSPPPGKVAE